MKQQLFTSLSAFVLKCAFLFSILVGLNVSAQTNPVQTNISTSPPYLNYLSYYGDQNNHLQITLTNLDFSLPPELVRLRIRIEGTGWELYTNPNATIGQPFLLEAGIPLTITGIDLLPYLQANNLINPSGVDLNNLPHGFATICVDVIRQSALQQVLSSNSCGFLPIQEYQPPQANPLDCGQVLNTNTMFHTFTWTPPVPMPNGIGLEVLYDLEIYHWDNPLNNVVLTGAYPPILPPIYDITTNTTQISDFNGILELGETYVWRVKARVLSNGMEIPLIENGGWSEPCTFIYGEAPTLADVLGDGLELELFTEPSSERKGRARWKVTDNTPNAGLSDFDAYFIEYRKQPTGNEGFEIPWFTKTITDTSMFIYQLEPSTTYEVKVAGVIAGTVGDPTAVRTFTTPDPRVYNCGESDVPYLPTNYTPLENATVGTQVKIGQFMMTMTEVVDIGSAGHYAGKGEIPIAFLAGAKAKVRFDDILIDTEYLVHEGRVDVVTEGLANWLDDQYQQFIDPYFVQGTIDSAYVQDSVAWVVVDGVAQSFNFDPPNYPIIVNDESGNQYTIYPDGTIVVGTYLSVSETWSVAANQTARFGQNANENRGFDPMEHMEWYENYETMQLSDNTFYYVANKSMAKGEADKVNVQFPPNVTAMSFELADGTPVGFVDLEGSWDGNKPYLDSGLVKTLNLPSFSSAGKYQVYAFANTVKVGQLNIQVYSKKDREVIVVPIASSNFSATQIEAELDQTLGEANIDVTVTLENPWVDSTGTFTSSTNLSMPSEVGMLSKYSDDMRELRDAYFEQNPSAPKNKYYLFLVNGFDDPNELGYMVRGRSMGFVKASQPNVLQTISHELGHGMGALEHTFKDEVLAKGSTNNLMDYSSNPTNLTKAQWKELRDLNIVPSLWDSAEDAASYSIGIAKLQSLIDSTNTFTFLRCNGKFITLPSNIKSVTFSTLNRTIDNLTHDDDDLLAPVGTIIGFRDAANDFYISSGSGIFAKSIDGSLGTPYNADTLTELYQPTSAISSMYLPSGGKIYEKYFRVVSPIGQTNYDLSPALALDKIIVFEPENADRTVDVFTFIHNNSLALPNPILEESTDFYFSNDNSPIKITNGDTITLMNFNSQELFVLLADELASVNTWIHYMVIASLREHDFQGFANCVDSQVQSVLNQQANEPNEQTSLLQQTTTPSSTLVPLTELQSAFDLAETFNSMSISALNAAREDLTESIIGKAVQQAYLNNSPAEIADLKATIANGIPFQVAQKINFVPECLLYSLTGAERVTALDKLSDDSYWHLIPNVLRNIPESERSGQELMIVNAIRTNNYQRLRNLVPQTSEWTDFTDQAEVSLLAEILEIVSLYTRRHQSNYPESTTTETISFVSDYIQGQIPNVYELEIPHIAIPITVGADGVADVDMGMLDNVDLLVNTGNKIHIKTNSNHPKFPLKLKSNGKIEVVQSFKLDDVALQVTSVKSYGYGTLPSNDYIYQINGSYELDPSDVVDIVIGAEYGIAGYDKGDILRVPAMTALLIQQNIDNADFNKDVRSIVNAVEVGVGIVAVASVPFTGGASLYTYIEVTAGIAGAVDEILAQQEYSMSTQELADATYLEDWKNIKIAVDLALAGTSISTLNLSGIGGSSAALGNSTASLITTGKTLRGGKHISVALSMKRSLRMTNTADNFTSPYLIQRNQAMKTSLRTGNAIVLANTSVVSKSTLLGKLNNYPDVQLWVNELDDITDLALITKLDNVGSEYWALLDIDIASVSNGTGLKLLIQENPDDMVDIYKLLKDDPKYSFELAKTGGSRWQVWAQGNFFKAVTQAGKDFEEFTINNLPTLRTMILSKYPTLDINQYELFTQVQIKTGIGEQYFVADILLVKRQTQTVQGIDIEILDFDNAIVFETKLSATTNLTTPQSNAVTKVQSNSNIFEVRSIQKTNSNGFSITNNDMIQVEDFVKVWSDGIGNVISGVNSLK